MSAWSVVLSAEVLISPEQTHIYRSYVTSSNFAQSFAMHLAAFASLGKLEREKIIDLAPSVLSCDLKGQGSVKQPDPVSPFGASLLSIGANSSQSLWDSFPYNLDFSPWINIDQTPVDSMEIEGTGPVGLTASASSLGQKTISNSCAQNAASNSTDDPLVDPCVSTERPQIYDKAEPVKTLLEDALEEMHTRLVENEALDTPLGRVFLCILDNRSDPGDGNGCVTGIKIEDDPITKFFDLICVKFKRLASVLTSDVVKGPGGLNLLRFSCEWTLLQTLCFSCLGITAGQRLRASPAQELYFVSREGFQSFQPLPLNGSKPWRDLRKVESAPLESWTLHRGYIVDVDTGFGSSPAKVSDLRCLDDGRFIVVYTWLYTRDQIAEEMKIDGKLSPHDRKHLDKRWPLGDRYEYMLSTNRTVTLWDTAITQSSEAVTTSLCYSAIYSTTPTSRKIWSVENPRFQWMKKILLYEPQVEDMRE